MMSPLASVIKSVPSALLNKSKILNMRKINHIASIVKMNSAELKSIAEAVETWSREMIALEENLTNTMDSSKLRK